MLEEQQEPEEEEEEEEEKAKDQELAAVVRAQFQQLDDKQLHIGDAVCYIRVLGCWMPFPKNSSTAETRSYHSPLFPGRGGASQPAPGREACIPPTSLYGRWSQTNAILARDLTSKERVRRWFAATLTVRSVIQNRVQKQVRDALFGTDAVLKSTCTLTGMNIRSHVLEDPSDSDSTACFGARRFLMDQLESFRALLRANVTDV